MVAPAIFRTSLARGGLKIHPALLRQSELEIVAKVGNLSYDILYRNSVLNGVEGFPDAKQSLGDISAACDLRKWIFIFGFPVTH